MTEEQWLCGTEPNAMLAFLLATGRASDRRLRLFAVACSRRVWDLLDQLGREAVEVAERHANSRADPEELRAARLACRYAGGQAAWYAAATRPAVAARNAALSAQHGAQAARNDLALHAECLAQADLLRDIFADPFLPLPLIALDWLGRERTVVKLATAIYEDHRFEDMPLLADALTASGCEDEAILRHCHRQGQPHVRGCWAVDLLTGRE